MKTIRGSILFLGLSALFSCGCSEAPEVAAKAGAAEIINTKCPIMGGDIDPELVKDWNGKKVAFCCPPCLEEWDELTDEEKAAHIANPGGGHDDASHDH